MKESEMLSDILKYFRDTQSMYNIALKGSDDKQLLQEDLLHKLEFKDKTAAERNKTTTAMKRCRDERRKHKDKVEVLRELIEFINGNQPAIKKLEKILGDMRRIEENQGKRVYRPRIMTEKEWGA
ncbi:hypothetical protein J2Z76_000468 [Sedimentibacter acidaminivorans]|uniref:Uncharacterized protein n=1 Tax=Sedimentibacter acidaminivorans TaxID=913099 RepID=A0ABS4GB44_9FIRM|nr:hypothetical protein [Sedimentibacter acidaminivorans]MBP1924615.1 hypothetical protein [Sedimentibacter acidaminivorans]